MCVMKIPVAIIFALFILCWTCNTITSDFLILCEKASVDISCQNGTKIQILDVQYGPLSHEEEMTEREPRINTTSFARLCNDKSHCYLNEPEIFEFDKYPYIPRLINFTYHCAFEYYGCYEDSALRLFTGGSVGSWPNPSDMSALICHNFCSSRLGVRPYFGTEVGYACFCGKENEIFKLNRTISPYYTWHNTKECNTDCLGHEYEKCGNHGLISIYTTETAQKNNKLKVEEVLGQKCSFNSSLKNVTMISYQRAKQCEPKGVENSNSYDCDKYGCWVKQVLPFVPGYLENNLPKFITVSYICQNQKDKNQVLSSVSKPNETVTLGVVMGSISGVCLICGCLIGFYMYKRKCRQTNISTTVDTQPYADLGATHADQKYDDDLTFTTQYEDLCAENQYHNMASIGTDHNYDVLTEAR